MIAIEGRSMGHRISLVALGGEDRQLARFSADEGQSLRHLFARCHCRSCCLALISRVSGWEPMSPYVGSFIEAGSWEFSVLILVSYSSFEGLLQISRVVPGSVMRASL